MSIDKRTLCFTCAKMYSIITVLWMVFTFFQFLRMKYEIRLQQYISVDAINMIGVSIGQLDRCKSMKTILKR